MPRNARRPTPSNPPTAAERYWARLLESQPGANENQPGANENQPGSNDCQPPAGQQQPGANVATLSGPPPWPLPAWLQEQWDRWLDDWLRDSEDD
jgi:hypothetical protein